MAEAAYGGFREPKPDESWTIDLRPEPAGGSTTRPSRPRIECAPTRRGFTVYADGLPVITVPGEGRARGIGKHLAAFDTTHGLAEFDCADPMEGVIRHVRGWSTHRNARPL